MSNETVCSPIKKKNNEIHLPRIKVRMSLASLILTSSVCVPLSYFAGKLAKNITSSKDPLQSYSELVDERHNETCGEPKLSNKKFHNDAIMQSHNNQDGQHLMIDINLSNRKMNKNYLEQTLVDLVEELGLSILSYHCHKLYEDSMTCIGMLAEGHISLIFWPKNEVLSIDVMSFESQRLFQEIHHSRTIRMLSKGDSNYRWAYKRRGQISELDSVQNFQSVRHFNAKDDIIFLDSDCTERFSNVESCNKYKNQNNLFSAEVYLDGKLIIPFLRDIKFYESLVHPALFAHENPKQVAIFGGDGATLREVLKHKTVEKVVLVVPEKNLINISKEYFPARSDCSDLIGSTSSCFDDSRVEIIEKDPIQYLLDGSEYKFDMIIMDSVDFDDRQDAPLLIDLDEEGSFDQLYEVLSKDGIVVTQLGRSPQSYDSPSRHFKNNEIISYLVEQGYMQSAFQYESFYQRYARPWSYVAMCKSRASNARWFLNSAEIDVSLHKRFMRTHSQKPSVSYYDAPVMRTIQVPPRAFETVYCRNEDAPLECQSLSTYPTFSNAGINSFEVRQSTIGEGAGRGVFSIVDIPQDTLMALEMAQLNVRLYPNTKGIVETYAEAFGEEFEHIGPYAVYSYMYAYGFSVYFFEGEAIFVDGSIMTFVNHGCNSTDNLGSIAEYFDPTVHEDFKEENFTIGSEIEMLDSTGDYDTNPAMLRHIELFNSGLDYAKTGIKAGEEIFQNYLTYESDPKELLEVAELFKSICKGEAVGEVSKYENGEKIY